MLKPVFIVCLNLLICMPGVTLERDVWRSRNCYFSNILEMDSLYTVVHHGHFVEHSAYLSGNACLGNHRIPPFYSLGQNMDQ